MRYFLICDCGSESFDYTVDDGYTCKACDTNYSEVEAGRELLGESIEFTKSERKNLSPL